MVRDSRVIADVETGRDSPARRSGALGQSPQVVYSVGEVAEIFGLSSYTVRSLISRGEIRAGKVGGAVRIAVEEVERIRSGLRK